MEWIKFQTITIHAKSTEHGQAIIINHMNINFIRSFLKDKEY